MYMLQSETGHLLAKPASLKVTVMAMKFQKLRKRKFGQETMFQW